MFAPKGVEHHFANLHPGKARFLCAHAREDRARLLPRHGRRDRRSTVAAHFAGAQTELTTPPLAIAMLPHS